MQLRVYHKVDQPLVLPLGYHHIVQSVLFRTLEAVPEYSGFLHDRGYEGKTRTFKLFTFGLLQGAYQIQGKNIVFTEDVSFEIRSIDPYMLKLLKEGFEKKGITYLGQTYREVSATLNNEEVDETELTIRMVSPVCVYSTDRESGKTVYYHPEEEAFYKRISESFRRKYEAYTGVAAESDISMELKKLHPKDKYITKYKGFTICAWKGTYVLRGKRQYLDFLYQTGLGSKNAQGFGMFEVV
ncbi:MAG: CRISPR-associated endoribonuclease Cas6 [Lachnospiraceae bacterium]|nr:CRISPR-associated endoribonuclease Cas6 [Lachnospiraceae bacterium]MBP3610169.1 CRISPR-associated endoribonuclease Cas6 [Lachnospiraceae bacterium]